MAVLLAWGLLPLPRWTGSLLLERVPGFRLPLALGFACVVLVALLATRHARGRAPAWEPALWTAAVGATVGLTVWSSLQLPVDRAELSMAAVVVCGSLVAIGFAFVAAGRSPRTAATALACFAVWSWCLVNPLYHGLGAFDDHPVVRAMRPVAEANPGVKVEVYGNSGLVALVRASGAQSLSGVTFYPNEPLMRRLAPAQREVWNNFAKYRWVADPAAAPVQLGPLVVSNVMTQVDPCAPEILDLGAEWAVSDRRLEFPCLQAVDEIAYGDATAFRYRVVR
jgi:hypothetical protein